MKRIADADLGVVLERTGTHQTTRQALLQLNLVLVISCKGRCCTSVSPGGAAEKNTVIEILQQEAGLGTHHSCEKRIRESDPHELRLCAMIIGGSEEKT